MHNLFVVATHLNAEVSATTHLENNPLYPHVINEEGYRSSCEFLTSNNFKFSFVLQRNENSRLTKQI